MNIERFGVEEWMDKYESDAKYNITDTCARPMTLKELFALAGEDREDFVEALFEKEQSYGSIYGLASLKEEIAGLYETITPDDILTQHGATGGNQHVLFSLVRPGDRVVAFSPSYQQFCSTPRALGANVTVLKLRRSNGFLPDLDELRKAAARGLRLICINNPNNPTGSLIPEDMMKEIVEIARSSGTYILCDEVYAGVSQHDEDICPSVADLYEKGIATGSMSKAFSLAGLRLGWLATRDKAALSQFRRVRDYDLVSCSLFDESVAALALHHKEKILERNRAILRHNLPVLERWVEGEKHVSFVKPKAGTMALVYYDLDMPSALFCHRMYHETGAFAVPGDCFEEPSSFRVGYGHDAETLERGLQAVSEFFKRLERE
jgi:aspartate/methionine/tyrosine aminotransferase